MTRLGSETIQHLSVKLLAKIYRAWFQSKVSAAPISLSPWHSTSPCLWNSIELAIFLKLKSSRQEVRCITISIQYHEPPVFHLQKLNFVHFLFSILNPWSSLLNPLSKISLHSHVCTGEFTQTGVTLTVFYSISVWYSIYFNPQEPGEREIEK